MKSYLSALARSCIAVLLSSLSCLIAQPARAQQVIAPVDTASLPDSPDAAQAQSSSSASPSTTTTASSTNTSLEGKQTKRILGIIPNFRAVSVDAKLPPMTVKEKLWGATQDSFDYSSFIYAGILAGISQWSDSYPEFHQGAAGYGRYYWHTFVDQADENYWTEFILPVAFRQDPRYYTLGRGGVFKRTVYSFSRAFITRTDSGNETFNVSEVVGAGAAAGISNLYYPEQYRTWTKTGQRWASNVALDSVDWIFKEFWPDINSKIFHQKAESSAPEK
ncbi:MAG TPA: hypothetical protein VE178_15830 [Silvibacterium sp.]|jgi:hypothetical protein|nr:hypothetical protein [Silvibacterium sp.]